MAHVLYKNIFAKLTIFPVLDVSATDDIVDDSSQHVSEDDVCEHIFADSVVYGSSGSGPLEGLVVRDSVFLDHFAFLVDRVLDDDSLGCHLRSGERSDAFECDGEVEASSDFFGHKLLEGFDSLLGGLVVPVLDGCFEVLKSMVFFDGVERVGSSFREVLLHPAPERMSSKEWLEVFYGPELRSEVDCGSLLCFDSLSQTAILCYEVAVMNGGSGSSIEPK